jgi:hypothetical protein
MPADPRDVLRWALLELNEAAQPSGEGERERLERAIKGAYDLGHIDGRAGEYSADEVARHMALSLAAPTSPPASAAAANHSEPPNSSSGERRPTVEDLERRLDAAIDATNVRGYVQVATDAIRELRALREDYRTMMRQWQEEETSAAPADGGEALREAIHGHLTDYAVAILGLTYNDVLTDRPKLLQRQCAERILAALSRSPVSDASNGGGA